jgi:2'-5' RNA ligase
VPDTASLSLARVFFALWPDAISLAHYTREAKRLHAQLGGRRTRAETIHLTLVFIGSVRRDDIPVLMAAADSVRGRAFDLVFDQAHCWRHNRIGYLAPSTTPEGLSSLVAALERALNASEVKFDQRPYKAHLTLVRQGNCQGMKETMVTDPITWPVTEFVLMESVLGPAGASYTRLAGFDLSDGHDAA